MRAGGFWGVRLFLKRNFRKGGANSCPAIARPEEKVERGRRIPKEAENHGLTREKDPGFSTISTKDAAGFVKKIEKGSNGGGAAGAAATE
jgi:hypothetical protein